jgi:hypothetical protein
MIKGRRARAFIRVQSVAAALAGALAAVAAAALTACDRPDVMLGVLPPPTPVTGACGAAPTVLASVAGVESRAVALDAANVYVVASPGGDGAGETVWRVPKTGASPQPIPMEPDRVGEVAAGPGAQLVAWTTVSADTDAGPPGTLWGLGDPSSRPVAIASGRRAPRAIFVDYERVYWAEQQSDATGRAFGAVVWTAISGELGVSLLQETDVDRVPHTFDTGDMLGGPALLWTTADPSLGNQATAEVVAAGLPFPFAEQQTIVAGDAGGVGALEGACDGALYYSSRTAIVRVDPIEQPRTVAATDGFVQRIEEDCVHLFYVDPATRQLTAVTLATGAARAIAEGVDPAGAFEADSACVYWVDPVAQAVMMVHS